MSGASDARNAEPALYADHLWSPAWLIEHDRAVHRDAACDIERTSENTLGKIGIEDRIPSDAEIAERVGETYATLVRRRVTRWEADRAGTIETRAGRAGHRAHR